MENLTTGWRELTHYDASRQRRLSKTIKVTTSGNHIKLATTCVIVAMRRVWHLEGSDVHYQYYYKCEVHSYDFFVLFLIKRFCLYSTFCFISVSYFFPTFWMKLYERTRGSYEIIYFATFAKFPTHTKSVPSLSDTNNALQTGIPIYIKHLDIDWHILTNILTYSYTLQN
jgi:hypothetical protein